MNSLRLLWSILTSKHRRLAVALFGWMLVGMVLETVGIGLVIPALGVMTQIDIAQDYPEFRPFLDFLGNPDQSRLVVIGMVILVAVYLVKTLFLSFLAYCQSRFVYTVQADLSLSLFNGYIKQPYPFHLQRNSAELIRNTIGQVTDATSVMHQGLILLTELLVLFGLAVLLISVEPFGAMLVIAVLSFAGYLGHVLTRAKILSWGEARQLHEGKRIQHLQQGLGGVKDVKLLGRESYFLEQYQTHNLGSARVAKYQVTLKALPRLVFELLAVVGLAVLVVAMIGQGKPVGTLLPTLGLFGAAAFRLLPSMNRIVMAIQGVRYHIPVIGTISEELRLLKDEEHKSTGVPLTFTDELVIKDIQFSYPGSVDTVLHGISMRINRGDSIGFIGGSGAGKSTLVDIILGLLKPCQGSVTIDGIDIRENMRGWQQQIGYVPQSIYLTDDTLKRNIAFGVPDHEIDEQAVRRAVSASQLESYIDSLPEGLETKVGERGVRLSGGQRQRIGIARALYHNPQVLVLDEATSSLDVETERGFMESVKALQGEKTVIIVAHRLSTVEHCDRLYRLSKGRVIEQGDANAVLTNIANSNWQ